MKKKLSLLLIEDDEIERMKFKRVCQNNNFKCSVVEAKNGETAIEFLNTTDSLPHLILLDLNMPKMNGMEFLKSLKANNKFKYIPTMVMSSSESFEDIKQCYEIGATGYMLKPLHLAEYEQKVISIYNYWSSNELILD